MYKTNIKYFLLTAIFSTQLSLNAFAMNYPNDDKTHRGPPLPIATKKQKDVSEDPKLVYDVQGRQILNQQPYNPNNNPQNFTTPKKQLEKKKSDNQ